MANKMPQKENIGSFIKSHYNLAGAPLLALGLLVLEKLMETEFICPKDRVFGVTYSLMYVFCTTLILTILVDSCQCGDLCGTRHGVGDVERGSASHREYKDRTCGCCCVFLQTIVKFVMSYKAPIFWFFILVADGRYWECCVTSIKDANVTATTEVKSFLLQIIQMIGLGLILIFVIVIVCKCETKSKRYENKHKDIIVKYTEEALEEQKKQQLEAFVTRSMEMESWDPALPDAEKKWEEIAKECRNKMVQNLRREEEAETQPGGDGALPLSDRRSQSPQ